MMALVSVGLSNPTTVGYCVGVSTVKEVQEALPKLSRQEIEAIRDWIDEYLEDHLELTEEVKAKLDQSRREQLPIGIGLNHLRETRSGFCSHA
jgi:hypothetical protein